MGGGTRRASIRQVGRRSSVATRTTDAPATSAAGSAAADTNGPRAEVHVSVRLWGPALTPFAVVYDERRRALRTRTRAEVGRTETITHAGNGACRTFLRSFLVRTARKPNLRVALFDFVKSSTAVEDHVFLGAVTFALADVLSAGVSTMKISGANTIAVTLRASRVDDALFAARRSVAVRVAVPEMRRRKLPHQLVTQSFDISRCAAVADPTAPPSWVPVYRSEAISLPAAPHERHVRFDAAIIPEWRLYGLNTPLRIRLLQHSPRSVRVSVGAVCHTSMQELQVLDPSRDSLPLFGGGRSSTQYVGRLFLTQAEPTKSGGVFSLTAQYHQFSLSGAKRALSLTMTRITGIRVERKYTSVRGVGHDDSSFGSREPASAGSGRSLDRFALKLRKHKVTSDNVAWTTPSGYNVIQTDDQPQVKSPRWRSWLQT